MASDKYLAVVGVGEEDTAHLRLLMRAVTAQLEHRWRWGTEDNADLIVIDPSELGGQIARNRAFSSGRRCAVMSNDEALRDGEVRLSKPLKNDALVALLNGMSANAATSGSSSVVRFTNDFYDVDSFNADFDLDSEVSESAPQREERPAVGLDELLKPDAEAVKPHVAVPINLTNDTVVAYAASSTRSETRHADSLLGQRRSDEKPEGINLGPRQTNAAPDNAMRPLRDYLTGQLLGGPSTVTLTGAPPLTLDPKERQYTAPGKLRDLIVYCRHDFGRDAFKPITSQELTRQRTDNGVSPYTRLIWLDVLVRSGGQLARHLDPGGRFRLKPHVLPERFPKHVSIFAALQQPAKLNEIAAAARVAMGDVFDVVNAYDAIGLIEMERRQPRHSEPDPPTGLLARLRKPFGR